MTEPIPEEALRLEARPVSAPDNIAIQDEPDTTREHRRRAAETLSETGKQVDVWIETGGVDPHAGPLNPLLDDLAVAFAEFEHELLLCPATIVHGMEDSTEVCANCGTSAEDFHTIHACFARYKQAQDDAYNQVSDYLSARIELLEKGLHVFWDDDSIWVVARDADDAALVYAEHIGDLWALNGGNPELDPATRETNRDWILREIADLELAIAAVKKALA